MTPRTFDRLVEFDERSRAYPIRQLTGVKPRRSYSWRLGTQLDQGREGACTGFAVSMEAAARPVCVPDVTNETARQIYQRARQLDQWPGENYEGSSVLAAMKAGAERGWYEEYRWAFSENDLALAVGYRGPAVCGTYWFEGMFRADETGFLRPTGEVVGGHAYVVTRYSVVRDAYWTPNSWGGDGQGWIHRNDMARLLEMDGDAAVPVKRSGR